MDKFIFSGVFLEKALKMVGDAVNQKTNLPVIKNILFVCKDKEASLTTTNLEITITLKLPYLKDGEDQEIKFLIDYKWLHDIVQASNKGNINIQILKKSIVISEDDGTSFSTGAPDPNDFVVSPKLKEDYSEIIINGNPFKDIYNKMSPFLKQNTDEVVGNFMLEENTKSIVTTNGFALAFNKMPFKDPKAFEKSLALTPNFVKLLSKMKIKDDEEMVIKNDGRIFYFEYQKVTISCTSSVYKVPNVQAIIPDKERCISFTMEREYFENVLKKIMIVHHDSRFSLSEKPHISAINDAKQEIKIPLVLETTDRLRSFTLNAKYLINVLNFLEGENVAFQYIPNMYGVLRIMNPAEPHKLCIMAPMADDQAKREADTYEDDKAPDEPENEVKQEKIEVDGSN